LIVRFLFGAGEAGAFPNGFAVISRWFKASERATMLGVALMSAQLGGALAPLLVVPTQMRFGWRASFFFFGLLGVMWAAVWYAWYRDSPEEKIGVTAEGERAASHDGGKEFPWRVAFRSQSVVAMLVLAFSYIYTVGFFQTWFHTFLVKGRGFSEGNLIISSLPYAVAACANLLGGTASDALVRRFGRTTGRRGPGVIALATAGLLIILVMVTRAQTLTVILLGLAYGAITFQQSGACGVCLDISHRSAGAMTGLFNTAISYGYIADRFGFDAPFIPMACLLFLGAIAWTRIDASVQLTPEEVEVGGKL
jgi:sugar phosphate permease